MIACAFAACSNEDDPIPSVDPTPTPEAGTADLTIVVKNLTKSTQTKAGEDENAKEGEAKIYNLFVALYNEDGTFLQVSDLTANEDEEVTDSNNEIQFKGLRLVLLIVLWLSRMFQRMLLPRPLTLLS